MCNSHDVTYKPFETTIQESVSNYDKNGNIILTRVFTKFTKDGDK